MVDPMGYFVELLEDGVHCRRTGLDLGNCASIQQPDTPSEGAEGCAVGGGRRSVRTPATHRPRQIRGPSDESLTGCESKVIPTTPLAAASERTRDIKASSSRPGSGS